MRGLLRGRRTVRRMPEKTDNVTLADVAREAGVSLKTASRVLNRTPVAAVTAKKVRAVMSRLNYRSNEFARRLKNKRSAVIGMVVPNLADPFYASAVQAAQEIARQNKHVVMLTSSMGDEAIEREEVESFVCRQVDGLIIAPTDGRNNTIESFLSSHVPVVAFDKPFSGVAVPSITVTNRDAAREATEHLLSHGYRRILAIGARPHLYTGAERLGGYIDTMKRANKKIETFVVDHEDELTPDIVQKLLLSGPGKLDAILTLNGTITVLILNLLRKFGKRVATDIALCSFDDYNIAEVLNPQLTAVRQPSEEIGRRAAELLFSTLLVDKRPPLQRIVLHTTFHIRESCGCRQNT